MSKNRSQAEIALQQHLKNKRLGIRPTRRGEKRPPLNKLLLEIDSRLNPDNGIQYPDWIIISKQKDE